MRQLMNNGLEEPNGSRGEVGMNAQTYMITTTRLAYYDAMKMTAEPRPEQVRRVKPPRKPLLGVRRERGMVLLPTQGGLNA
jgi:hypothetical protein